MDELSDTKIHNAKLPKDMFLRLPPMLLGERAPGPPSGACL